MTYFIYDQVNDGISQGSGNVQLDGVMVKLMTGPEDVDFVQRSVHPVINEFCKQQRQEPSGVGSLR